MKKGVTICILTFAMFVLQSNMKRVTSSNFPPTNCTGAPNAYTCQFCHSSYQTNMAGGAIGLTGIPANFIVGQSYPFNINIKHFASDRKKFGYDVAALDALGNPYGTFSTSNANSTVNAGELTSHLPLDLAATNQTTISGFTWNAPVIAPTSDQLPITFYFCGNACNGDGTVKGDYVYNDSVVTTIGVLPIVIEQFEVTRKSDNEIQLDWSFGDEGLLSGYVIQRKVDANLFVDMDTIPVKFASVSSNKYAYFDKTVSSSTTFSYRIRYVSKDGSSSFSRIKVIGPATHLEKFRMYPNPVEKNSLMKLVFSANQNKVCSIAIVGVTGNLILKKTQKVVAGDNTVSIPIMNTIARGTYFLIISSEHSILHQEPFIIR